MVSKVVREQAAQLLSGNVVLVEELLRVLGLSGCESAGFGFAAADGDAETCATGAPPGEALRAAAAHDASVAKIEAATLPAAQVPSEHVGTMPVAAGTAGVDALGAEGRAAEGASGEMQEAVGAPAAVGAREQLKKVAMSARGEEGACTSAPGDGVEAGFREEPRGDEQGGAQTRKGAQTRRGAQTRGGAQMRRRVACAATTDAKGRRSRKLQPLLQLLQLHVPRDSEMTLTEH